MLSSSPDVGGDANLQGGVEEPEPDLAGGDAYLQESVDVLTHPKSISIILFHAYFLSFHYPLFSSILISTNSAKSLYSYNIIIRHLPSEAIFHNISGF